MLNMKLIEKKIQKFKNFKEQENADYEYWKNISGEDKIKISLELSAAFVQTFYPEFNGIEKIIKIRKLREEE